jgi:hypothetical protein
MDYSLSLQLFPTKKYDFFNIPKKKEDTAYNRGYNAALQKCNQKMKRILKSISAGYIQAMKDDDDDFY